MEEKRDGEVERDKFKKWRTSFHPKLHAGQSIGDGPDRFNRSPAYERILAGERVILRGERSDFEGKKRRKEREIEKLEKVWREKVKKIN